MRSVVSMLLPSSWLEHPLARAGIDAPATTNSDSVSERELAEREHRDEQQVQRRRDRADRRQQRELAHQLLRLRDRNGTQQQQRGEEHVPDHRADRRDAALQVGRLAPAARCATVSSTRSSTAIAAKRAQHHRERMRLDAGSDQRRAARSPAPQRRQPALRPPPGVGTATAGDSANSQRSTPSRPRATRRDRQAARVQRRRRARAPPPVIRSNACARACPSAGKAGRAGPAPSGDSTAMNTRLPAWHEAISRVQQRCARRLAPAAPPCRPGTAAAPARTAARTARRGRRCRARPRHDARGQPSANEQRHRPCASAVPTARAAAPHGARGRHRSTSQRGERCRPAPRSRRHVRCADRRSARGPRNALQRRPRPLGQLDPAVAHWRARRRRVRRAPASVRSRNSRHAADQRRAAPARAAASRSSARGVRDGLSSARSQSTSARRSTRPARRIPSAAPAAPPAPESGARSTADAAMPSSRLGRSPQTRPCLLASTAASARLDTLSFL